MLPTICKRVNVFQPLAFVRFFYVLFYFKLHLLQQLPAFDLQHQQIWTGSKLLDVGEGWFYKQRILFQKDSFHLSMVLPKLHQHLG